MNADLLIQELTEQTRRIQARAEQLRTYEIATLTRRPAPASWNILECVEHLNRYGNYYLPQIDANIRRSRSGHEAKFRSGLLGGYFAKSMLPKEKLNKMRTFREMDTLHTALDKTAIDRFIEQQNTFIELLERAKHVSLNAVKIESSFSRFIRMKLGDVLQFYINHILRHLQQIDNILASDTNA